MYFVFYSLSVCLFEKVVQIVTQNGPVKIVQHLNSEDLSLNTVSELYSIGALCSRPWYTQLENEVVGQGQWCQILTEMNASRQHTELENHKLALSILYCIFIFLNIECLKLLF